MAYYYANIDHDTGALPIHLFFQKQEIIPENEWDDFMAALRRELPSTFRITGTRRYC